MAQGIKFGAYHFARPEQRPGAARPTGSSTTPDYQHGMLIPTLDLERTGGLGPTGAHQLGQGVARARRRAPRRQADDLHRARRSGGRNMGDTRWFADNGYAILWVAHWGVASPSVPGRRTGAARSWTFWQYTSDGTRARASPGGSTSTGTASIVRRGHVLTVAPDVAQASGRPPPRSIAPVTTVGAGRAGRILALVPAHDEAARIGAGRRGRAPARARPRRRRRLERRHRRARRARRRARHPPVAEPGQGRRAPGRLRGRARGRAPRRSSPSMATASTTPPRSRRSSAPTPGARSPASPTRADRRRARASAGCRRSRRLANWLGTVDAVGGAGPLDRGQPVRLPAGRAGG